MEISAISAGRAPLDFLRARKDDLRQITLEKGSIACEIGNACEALPIVLEGCIRIYRPARDGRMVTLYRVMAGESCVLTAACILNQTPFPGIAEIEEPLSAYLVPSKKVLEWLDRPEWQAFMFNQLSVRMVDLIELADDLAFHKIDGRIARILVKRQRQGVIHTTHQQLGDEIGTSREVVSRALKNLEACGCIKLGRNTVQIRDFAYLSQLAE